MMELRSGERQVHADLEGIRADHRARYEWVAGQVGPNEVFIDAGCGVGYGSHMLAEAGAHVKAFDISEDSIAFAQKHWAHPKAHYRAANIYDVDFPTNASAIVAFEILEHVADPDRVLYNFGKMADTLYVSVPNEDKFPYHGRIRFHRRHYTKGQLQELLGRNGWAVSEWWGQEGPESPVERGVEGRTLVAKCRRVAEPVLPIEALQPDDAELQKHLLRGHRPKSVAILGMGPSLQSWTHVCAAKGGKFRMADEVWVTNGLGAVLAHDRVFAMDDFAIQESRVGSAENNLHVEGMVEWLPSHPCVYTSRAYVDRYPRAREYPLEWVLNEVGVYPYFKGTPPYMIAMAIALGVKDIVVYGMDFHYGNGDIKRREDGRSCVEFWLGVAEARGIKTHVPNTSSLFNMTEGGRAELYGYDTEWVSVEHTDRFRVSRVPRKPEHVPTADDIAKRYDHRVNEPSQGKPGAPADASASPAA